MDNSDDKKDETGSQTKEVPAGFQKICLVCGDKALGYNFNAISCESCKAFFRRNALSSKEFKCPFTNNCAISVVTRRFCQKCRLNKCLAIGMVKDFIMSEEDKAEKRRKIEENRAKKRKLRDSEDAVSSSKCVKRDEEKGSPYNIPVQDTVIQYDSLTTTCSPSSTTVQSPLSAHDLESSLQSPVYQFPPNVQALHETHSNDTQYQSNDNQYRTNDTQFQSNDIHYQSNDTQYPTDDTQFHTNDTQYSMKVLPIDEKSVINRALYTHRMMSPIEPYNRFNGVESDLYSEPPKQNTIRSILTNGESIPYREMTKSQHICEELPSTSSDPDVNKARDILQDVERIEPNSMESILCEAIKLEFEAYTSVNPCSGSSRELNEVERAKLNELIVANKALNAPIDDDLSQLIGDMTSTAGFKSGNDKHDPRLITIVNLTAVAIRRFIKMAKKINAFKNMCEEDQVALLKGGCIEMMVLRSTMTYDGQRNQWKIPHCQEQSCGIRTDLLKLAKGNLYRTHESFISTFEPGWRTDENIILVMCAILLFSPDRARVVHRDVIKLEQNSYYYLLRRYLESVYPGCEAKSTFLKLIKKILELRKLAEEITGVYLDVNPIEPLLMEIFDLKHHAA